MVDRLSSNRFINLPYYQLDVGRRSAIFTSFNIMLLLAIVCDCRFVLLLKQCHQFADCLVFFNNILVLDAIQCYSCKGTAGNEIEANIHCLETANLEDCNDFYEYYR